MKTPVQEIIEKVGDLLIGQIDLDELLEREKQSYIEFHVLTMEKGLEADASEYKKSEWDKIVRLQAEKVYKKRFY